VERVAQKKAHAVAARWPQKLVLAADTTVVLEGRLLGKPKNSVDASRTLSELSGRTHTVLTAVAVAGRHTGRRLVRTQVHFRNLSPTEIDWYVGTGEPMDKAGAYAIQGVGGCLVRGIEGSASNVVGLPLAETLELLLESGLALPWARGA
jgi:septum formation protein